jgi:hypothetical protein
MIESLMRTLVPVVVAGGLTAPVFADQAHHTTRLAWLDVNAADEHPPLTVGHAVDVHTEGDPKASIQYFFVHGAKPETTYEVVYFIDGFDTNLCARIDTFAAHLDVFLETDERGVGRTSLASRQDELGLVGMYYGVRFQLVDTESDALAYETACMVTTTDP